MALTTTRVLRADRCGIARVLATAIVAVTAFQLFSTTGALADARKPQTRASKPASRVVQPAIPDSQADQLNAKWLTEHRQATTGPAAAEPDDERVSSVPSMAPPMSTGSRSVAGDSLKIYRADNPTQALGSIAGVSAATIKELTQAFAGFTSSSAKVDMVQGKTVDGWSRTFYASVGEGKSRQTFWWFAPPDQPEGWFDEQGKRLGGTTLAEPKPDARVSSPFGTRRSYGRSAGGGFHNGIDFEGKAGEPIYAAADGVVNHQGWYYNYGRTVKISHADNFETLYAHMSRFAPGVTPGVQVRKGDLIGYIGSTGRSTGPHLHFSTIVNGQFVDPQPFISQQGDGQLHAHSMVAFRQWQQKVRTAVERKRAEMDRGRYRGGQGEWSQNPFAPTGERQI